MKKNPIKLSTLANKSSDSGDYTGQVGEGGLKEGFGQLRTKEGVIFQGEWKHDLLNGLAIIQKKDEQFFGFFKHDEKHGIGCHDYEDKTFITKYVKDEIDENFASELHLPDMVYKLGKIDPKKFRLTGYGEIDKYLEDEHIKGFFRKDILDGFGKIKNPEIEKIGDFVDGNLTGVGKIINSDGHVLISEFNYENPIGFSIEIEDDDYYCGDFDQDRVKVGNALIKKTGKFEYVGQIEKGGIFHGQGKLKDWTKNEVYIGNFVEGIKSGIGYSERFVVDKQGNDSEVVFYGNFENGQPNGKGIEKIGFEERFVGNFVDGVRQGAGLLFNKDTMSLEPAFFDNGKKVEDRKLNSVKITDELEEFMDKEPAVEKEKISQEVDNIEFILKGKREAFENSPNLDIDYAFERATQNLRKKRELLLKELKKQSKKYKKLYKYFLDAVGRKGFDFSGIELNNFHEDKVRKMEKEVLDDQDVVDFKLKLPLDELDSEDENFGKPEQGDTTEEMTVEGQDDVEEKKVEEEGKEEEVKIVDETLDDYLGDISEEEDSKISPVEKLDFSKKKKRRVPEVKKNQNYEKVKKVETRKYGNMQISRVLASRQSKGNYTNRTLKTPRWRRRKKKRPKKKKKSSKKVVFNIYKKVIHDDNLARKYYTSSGNRIPGISDHPFYSGAQTSRERYYKDYGIDSMQQRWSNSLERLRKTNLTNRDKLLEYEEFFDGPGTVKQYTRTPQGKKRRRVFKFNTDYNPMWEETVGFRSARKPREGSEDYDYDDIDRDQLRKDAEFLHDLTIPKRKSKSRIKQEEELGKLGIKNPDIVDMILSTEVEPQKKEVLKQKEKETGREKVILKGILKKENYQPMKRKRKKRRRKGPREKEWKKIQGLKSGY